MPCKWLICRDNRRGNGAVKLIFRNENTELDYFLGSVASDVTDEMIWGWIREYGGIRKNEIVVMSDGTEMVFNGETLIPVLIPSLWGPISVFEGLGATA